MMASIKNVLSNIINKNYHFCAICFEFNEENFVSIEDEVVFRSNGAQNTLKVSDILSVVLSKEVYNIMSTFQLLCNQCVKSAVSSYKFLTIAKENCLALRDSLESLTLCLNNTSDSGELYYKSVFVTLNPIDFSTQQYYDSKNPVTSLTSACRRLELLINPKPIDTKKAKKKCDINTIIKHENTNESKKFHSSTIKTSEMLYDKNDRSTLKCKICLQIYPSTSNLRNHFIRVHAPKNFTCSTCKRKFGSMSLLEAHKHQSHCTIVCNECGRIFHNRHTLKMHLIGHNNKIVCEDCGRVYKSRTTFKRHIDLDICSQKTRAHPSGAKFTCDYCNKKYTQKVSLRVHIQYEHGNYKAHVCKWCDKKFWAKSRLKAHIVKHTQEKKFGCNICGGRFVTKESLLYHTRTHTGEKPYSCHLCDNKFLSASRRADHIKRHHLAAPLKRDVCNDQVRTQTCLENQKNMHLNEHTQTDSKKESENLIKVSDGQNIVYLEVSALDYNAAIMS